MNRDKMIEQLALDGTTWDMVIVGGGATGLGCAVDAASRGYRTVLVERSDFASGTSSRSTKLIHGGVRYLRQGNVALVLDSLRERGLLRRNAPHLVADLPFVVPVYDWWEGPFYGAGLRIYDLLAGKYGFGRSGNLSREETIERLPTIEQEGLRGGAIYYDGQFDDARLAIALAATAVDHGATVANYCEVTGLLKQGPGVTGVHVVDRETGRGFPIRARVVVNATGVFSDEVRAMDDAGGAKLMQPSRGTHIVLDREFLPGDHAIMVPYTDDGRVLFAIPWLDRVVIGTTEVAQAGPVEHPVASAEEIEFLLEHIARYLGKDPSISDIKSVYSGLRPLVRRGESNDTASLTRDHEVVISHGGLVTIAGGKWTTYRRMAEDTINQAAVVAGLDEVRCVTRTLDIHGRATSPVASAALAQYGSDASAVKELADTSPPLALPVSDDFGFTGAQVVWAVRMEMARTVEDLLARRTRALLLDARAAAAAAPAVARIMAAELGRDSEWQAREIKTFQRLARDYCAA